MISWCSSDGFLLFFISSLLLSSSPENANRPLFALKKKNPKKQQQLKDQIFWVCVIVFWVTSCFLSFLWAFCVIFYLLLFVWLLKEWFAPFEHAAVWKAGHYCGCTCVCPRLCRTDRARLFRQHHTCWVTLLHRDHRFMEHRGEKRRDKQILVVLLEAIHHLSELYVKWNIIFNNSVLIYLFD